MTSQKTHFHKKHFRFWLSGNTRLDVCLLEDKVSEAVDCQKIVLKQPGPAFVDLPEINHPIRIALKAESSSQGMALIDDLIVTVRIILLKRLQVRKDKKQNFSSLLEIICNFCIKRDLGNPKKTIF